MENHRDQGRGVSMKRGSSDSMGDQGWKEVWSASSKGTDGHLLRGDGGIQEQLSQDAGRSLTPGEVLFAELLEERRKHHVQTRNAIGISLAGLLAFGLFLAFLQVPAVVGILLLGVAAPTLWALFRLRGPAHSLRAALSRYGPPEEFRRQIIAELNVNAERRDIGGLTFLPSWCVDRSKASFMRLADVVWVCVTEVWSRGGHAGDYLVVRDRHGNAISVDAVKTEKVFAEFARRVPGVFLGYDYALQRQWEHNPEKVYEAVERRARSAKPSPAPPGRPIPVVAELPNEDATWIWREVCHWEIGTYRSHRVTIEQPDLPPVSRWEASLGGEAWTAQARYSRAVVDGRVVSREPQEYGWLGVLRHEFALPGSPETSIVLEHRPKSGRWLCLVDGVEANPRPRWVGFIGPALILAVILIPVILVWHMIGASERDMQRQAEADRQRASERAQARTEEAFHRRIADIIRQGDWASLDKAGSVAVPAVVACLSNRQETKLMRANAAEALGRLRDTRAVEPLIAALEDRDRNVQTAAAISLGQIGDVQAVEPLSGALQHGSAGVRLAAASSLAELGDDRALDPLTRCAADDPDQQVRRAAAEAAAKIKARLQ